MLAILTKSEAHSLLSLCRAIGKPLFPEELLEWLDAKATEQAQQSNHRPIDNKAKPSPTYKLPSGLSVKDLPPSLKPPPIGKDYDWTSTATWG
jgi:hypothetical protein